MRTAGFWLLLVIQSRLSAQGSYLSYSTYLGGDGEDIVHAVATDSSGNVYLAGETTSSNFPVTAGAFQTKLLRRLPANRILAVTALSPTLPSVLPLPRLRCR